jgi:hypothetical protein
LLGLVRIVRTAPQGHVLGSARAASSVWLNVVEFKKPGFGATAVRPKEGATPAIAHPDLALDGGGDVARPRRERTRASRPRGRGELRPRELIEEERQRSIKDRPGVPI